MSEKINSRLFLILLAAIAGASLHAQPTLEHTYPYEVHRHQVSGAERYIRTPYLESGVWKLDVFGPDHQLSGTTALSISAADEDLVFVGGSTDFFDSDSGMEMVIQHDAPDGSRYYSVLDDNGNALSSPFRSSPQQYVLSDGSKKLIVTDTVFTVPGLQPEYVFTSHYQPVQVGRLEEFGDKYYLFNGEGLHLYNLDYTVFKTIPVVPSDFASVPYHATLLGQYQVNGDAAIEWRLFSLPSTVVKAQFYSENNLLSTHTINANYLNYNDEVLLKNTWTGLSESKSVLLNYGNSAPKFSVMDMLSGAVEFERTGSWRTINTLGNGVKYCPRIPLATDTSITVYNSDYTEWATIPWNPIDYRIMGAYSGIFDANTLNKELLVDRATGASSRFVVYDTTGQAVFTSGLCNLCRGGLVSQVVNTSNKFMAIGLSKTQVYGLPSSGPVSGINENSLPTLTISVFPNPVESSVQVDLQFVVTSKVQLAVFNSSGSIIHHEKNVNGGSLHRIHESQQWPAGMYWLKITADNGTFGWAKIIKQ